jgi:hypothetical protein
MTGQEGTGAFGRLRLSEDGLQVRWNAAGDRNSFIADNKKPPREFLDSLGGFT